MSQPDPYRPPEAPLTGVGESADPLRAFLDTRADYYLLKWESLRRGDSPLAGFNWAAAFFQTYWLFYRKLYAWGALFLLIPWVVGFATVYGLPLSNLPNELVLALAGGGLMWNAIWFLGFGFGANVLLYRHAQRVGEQTVPAWNPRELRKRGGTSAAAALLALLASSSVAWWMGTLRFSVSY